MTQTNSSTEVNADVVPEARQQIMQALRGIEADENVQILFAVESGSRAWGFPSPDSDYDVRFVYVRPMEWYLSIFPGRDVVELPLEGELDVNGWDIKKSLELLMKPNPVMLEWLSSPIRYVWDEDACEQIEVFSKKAAHAKSCLYHYMHLGGRQWRAYIEGKDQVNLKKYLYVVRPAMAIQWIRKNPDILPPMNFFELRAGIDLSDDLTAALDDIIEKKRQSKETGEGPAVSVINDFILDEFKWAEEAVQSLKEEKEQFIDEADELFRKLIMGDTALRVFGE